MNQKTALYISAGATAFMLFTAGAVIRVTSQPQTVAAQAAIAAQPVALPTLVPIDDAIAASNVVAVQSPSQQTTSPVLRTVTVSQVSTVAMSRSSQ